MKTWIAFLAGGVFAVSLVIACGGRGPAPAGAQGNVTWEYATLYGIAQTPNMPSGAVAPAGLAGCGIGDANAACLLNAFGADHWELSHYDLGNLVVFKRPK
jgi:hypothetical protein